MVLTLLATLSMAMAVDDRVFNEIQCDGAQVGIMLKIGIESRVVEIADRRVN